MTEFDVEKDYYKALSDPELGDLPKTAKPDEVKRAYRALARKYHPDANKGDLKAEERFKEITEGYAVLSDEKRRKAYNEARELFGSGGLRGPSGPQAQGGRGSTGNPLQDLMDNLFRSDSGLFGSGSAWQRPAPPRPTQAGTYREPPRTDRRASAGSASYQQPPDPPPRPAPESEPESEPEPTIVVYRKAADAEPTVLAWKVSSFAAMLLDDSTFCSRAVSFVQEAGLPDAVRGSLTFGYTYLMDRAVLVSFRELVDEQRDVESMAEASPREDAVYQAALAELAAQILESPEARKRTYGATSLDPKVVGRLADTTLDAVDGLFRARLATQSQRHKRAAEVTTGLDSLLPVNDGAHSPFDVAVNSAARKFLELYYGPDASRWEPRPIPLGTLPPPFAQVMTALAGDDLPQAKSIASNTRRFGNPQIFDGLNSMLQETGGMRSAHRKAADRDARGTDVAVAVLTAAANAAVQLNLINAPRDGAYQAEALAGVTLNAAASPEVVKPEHLIPAGSPLAREYGSPSVADVEWL